MMKSRMAELLVKKIGKEASLQELNELSKLLFRNPDFAYLHEVVLSLKQVGKHFGKEVSKEELVRQGWQHLSEKLKLESGFSTSSQTA